MSGEVRTAQATPKASTMPVRFEPNVGQAEAGVQYLARAGDSVLLLDGAGARLTADGATLLRLGFAGGSAAQALKGAGPVRGVARYYVGDAPANWRPNVPLFPTVRASDVYPGIDVVYYAGG
ncbi:MAG: hypothetical protein ACO1SX_03385, partial [Actinomycetota bacterium]